MRNHAQLWDVSTWPVAAQAVFGFIMLGAAAAAVVFGLSSPPPPAGTSDPAPAFGLAATQAAPVAAFLGDSYTGGSNMGGDPRTGRNYAIELSKAEGWVPDLFAVGGTGYLQANTGLSNAFGSRVPAVVASGASIVFVEGGHNDVIRYSVAEIKAEAARVLSGVAAGLPRARIVVIGPIWPNGNPDSKALAADAAIRDDAASAHLAFIDPIGEGWFAGAWHALIGADGTHPTDAGHAHIAQVLGADLLRMGISVR